MEACAFALGALSHYASDIAGHPAVNLAVAIEVPNKRNYTACLKGYGYCDPSRLTLQEARTIRPGD
jgi:hypothetical protein